MQDRRVKTAVQIIEFIYRQNAGTNTIIEQTGLKDRTFAYDIFDDMRKEGIIVEYPDSTHSQRRIQRLTPLGLEIAKLTRSIKEFTVKFVDISATVFERYDVDPAGPENTISAKLRSRGWAADLAYGYPTMYREVLKFYTHSLNSFLDAVLGKYLTIIMLRRPKSFTQELLNHILVLAINSQFELISKNTKINESLRKAISRSVLGRFPHEVRDYIYFNSPSFINTPFIDPMKDEIKRSVIEVLDPSEDDLNDFVRPIIEQSQAENAPEEINKEFFQFLSSWKKSSRPGDVYST